MTDDLTRVQFRIALTEPAAYEMPLNASRRASFSIAER